VYWDTLNGYVVSDSEHVIIAFCDNPALGAGEVFCGQPNGGELLQSWSSIYSCGQVTDARSGFIALNPQSSGTGDELWVSTPSGLTKIVYANTTPSPAPVALPTGTIPGAIAFTPDGVVYIISLGGPTSPLGPNTGLLRSPDGGETWVDVTGPAPGLAANVSDPRDMTIDPTGRIYIASDANIIAQGVSRCRVEHAGRRRPAQPAGGVLQCRLASGRFDWASNRNRTDHQRTMAYAPHRL